MPETRSLRGWGRPLERKTLERGQPGLALRPSASPDAAPRRPHAPGSSQPRWLPRPCWAPAARWGDKGAPRAAGPARQARGSPREGSPGAQPPLVAVSAALSSFCLFIFMLRSSASFYDALRDVSYVRQAISENLSSCTNSSATEELYSCAVLLLLSTAPAADRGLLHLQVVFACSTGGAADTELGAIWTGLNCGATACTPGPAASLCLVWPLFFPQGSRRRRSAAEQRRERGARQAPQRSGRAAGAAPQGPLGGRRCRKRCHPYPARKETNKPKKRPL